MFINENDHFNMTESIFNTFINFNKILTQVMNKSDFILNMLIKRQIQSSERNVIIFMNIMIKSELAIIFNFRASQIQFTNERNFKIYNWRKSNVKKLKTIMKYLWIVLQNCLLLHVFFLFFSFLFYEQFVFFC